MTGGKSRPKKDRGIKASAGEEVKTGQILSRLLNNYKPGANVAGENTLYALCSGKVYFTKKKTSHGRVRTLINILPKEEQEKH